MDVGAHRLGPCSILWQKPGDAEQVKQFNLLNHIKALVQIEPIITIEQKP